MPLLTYDYLHLVNCPEVVTISDILCKRIDLQEIIFSRRESVFQGVLFYTITSRPWFGLTVDIPHGGELTIEP